jgi:hypothetical protein
MKKGGILLACGILFLFFFTHLYIWSENKDLPKRGEYLKKEPSRRKQEHDEAFLRRIQGEVRKTLEADISYHSIKPEFTHIDPDLSDRAPKDEKVVFTQAVTVEKKTLKTRLDIKLGRTRKLAQITKEISFDKWKVQYNYNAQNKLHSFKGDAEMAGFDAHIVINSKQKPAFSTSRPIEVSEAIKIVPYGNCNFENKNFGLGLTGSVNKNLSASVFINNSPGVKIMGYSFIGSIRNIVDIKLQGKTVLRNDNPQVNRATHKGMLMKKLGHHVSVLAGLQYENSMITNPSVSFVYSRKF